LLKIVIVKCQTMSHRPSGWAPLHRTNQLAISIISHFYARCPSCCNLPNLSWLGTGTKCAG